MFVFYEWVGDRKKGTTKSGGDDDICLLACAATADDDVENDDDDAQALSFSLIAFLNLGLSNIFSALLTSKNTEEDIHKETFFDRMMENKKCL